VHCVVAAQPVLSGQLSGLVDERAVDADDQQLTMQRLELFAGELVPGSGQTPAASRARECRAALGVVENARCAGKRRVPQLGCDLGVILNDDELDQRRGVEVQDQRRC
jgi:hypothetical protein